MDNLICVCGPRGAGKETTVNAILSSPYGAHFRRVVPFTTRARRPLEVHGRDMYFVSKRTHLRMKNSDSILYSVQVGEGVGRYSSGLTREEFCRHENGVLDVTVEGARALRAHARCSLLIFVCASPEERCQRIMKRQGLSEAEALAVMRNEPSPGTLENAGKLYSEFVIIENRDGVGIESILTPIYDFLEALVPR